MNKYSTIQIRNRVSSTLIHEQSTDDAKDVFLMMKMMNDLDSSNCLPNLKWDNTNHASKVPTAKDIHINLLGNNILNETDFQLKGTANSELSIKLSPTCILHAETHYKYLKITINKKYITSMHIGEYNAGDIALWIIRQKEKLTDYMNEWQTLLMNIAKKNKSEQMAFLAIKAIFTEAMKDYPNVKYMIIQQQQKRARITITIPDTNLGINIYAWWGSYKQTLHNQIESLKKLLDTHRNICIKQFFITKN